MRSFRSSLWMFPEGTRTSSEVSDMLPLKKGGFHMALQAGVPIIPIVAENYWRLYHKGLFASGTIKVRGTIFPEHRGITLTGSHSPARNFDDWTHGFGYSYAGNSSAESNAGSIARHFR